MTITINKQAQKAFSSSAVRYDDACCVQRQIGERLLRKIPIARKYNRILDIGMGTGELTNRLSCLFPETRIVGMDFAKGMVDCAKKKYDSFSILQADAGALPFKNNVFDMIVSNAAYQWVVSLQEAFTSAYQSLTREGLFCASVFTQNSLLELFEVLRDILSLKEKNPRVFLKRLPSREDVCCAIKKSGFTTTAEEHHLMKVYFKDMLALIKWLKNIGANALQNRFYIGKEALLKANEMYHSRFSDEKGDYATLEIIWMAAEK